MKLATAVPVPYFSYPDTITTRRERSRRVVAARRPQPTLLDESDELDHKQEVVCAALLGLSFVSTVALCMWQLATA